MAYLEWTDELNTGIHVIDGQHKRIVNYINLLHDTCQTEAQDKTTEIISAMVDYTLSHFAFEETLIEEAGYKKCPQHIQQHDEFRNKIYKLRDRALAGEDVASILLKLLHDWLFEHILQEDGQYVATVKQHFAYLEPGQKENWPKSRIRRFFK